DVSGLDAASRSSILQALKDYGFVSGYGRDWSKPRFSDKMEELLMVFNSDWGAATTASTSRTSYSKDDHYNSFFDPQVNADAAGRVRHRRGRVRRVQAAAARLRGRGRAEAVTLPKVVRGRAWKFGNNVDTDQVIPAKYAVYSLDEKELGKHAMEGVPGRDTW